MAKYSPTVTSPHGDTQSIDLGRRIKAAQILGGFASVEQLATAINAAGMSAKTLRRMIDADDPRQPEHHELVAIARACDVPESFFSADFEFQNGEDDTRHQLARIAVELAEHRAYVKEINETPKTNFVAERIIDRITDVEIRQKDILEALERVLSLLAQREIEDAAGQTARQGYEVRGKGATADRPGERG